MRKLLLLICLALPLCGVADASKLDLLNLTSDAFSGGNIRIVFPGRMVCYATMPPSYGKEGKADIEVVPGSPEDAVFQEAIKKIENIQAERKAKAEVEAKKAKEREELELYKRLKAKYENKEASK